MRLSDLKKAIYFLTLTLALFGCKVTMQEANKEFGLHHYAVSGDMYKQVLKNSDVTKEDKQLACFNAGESYRLVHNSKEALKYYARAERYGMKVRSVK